MRGGMMGLCLLAFAGCTEVGEPEVVRIVAVECEPQMGISDCRTVVEFPDGRRRVRAGSWGEVGDSFTAQTVRHATESREFWQ